MIYLLNKVDDLLVQVLDGILHGSDTGGEIAFLGGIHIITFCAGDMGSLIVGSLTDVEEDVSLIVQDLLGILNGDVLHSNVSSGCLGGSLSGSVGSSVNGRSFGYLGQSDIDPELLEGFIPLSRDFSDDFNDDMTKDFITSYPGDISVESELFPTVEEDFSIGDIGDVDNDGDIDQDDKNWYPNSEGCILSLFIKFI